MANVPRTAFPLPAAATEESIRFTLTEDQVAYVTEWRDRVAPLKTLSQFIQSEIVRAALKTRRNELLTAQKVAYEGARWTDGDVTSNEFNAESARLLP